MQCLHQLVPVTANAPVSSVVSLLHPYLWSLTHRSLGVKPAMMIAMQGPSEEEQDEDKEQPLPLLPTLKALQAAWQAASKQTALKQAPSVAKALQESLQPGA